MIYKAQGNANQTIADRLDINIKTVKLCLSRYKSGGIQEAIFDKQRKGRPVEIMNDSVSWINDIACQCYADLGYSQELWTLKNLHFHIQSHVAEAGFPRLTTIAKPMIQKILSRNELKPFKILPRKVRS